MNKVKPNVTFKEHDSTHGSLTITPLLQGMGQTMGNALRRVLLSSLSGNAVSWIKIDGITNEFDQLPHAVEDILDLIFNLKAVVFVCDADEKILTLNFSGKGCVTAKDIESDSEVTVVNPEQHLIEFSEKSELKLTFCLKKGFGYVDSEQHKTEDQDIDTILLDSSFSPIVRVNHHIENVRIGRDLGYEKLTVDVWSNGSLTAEDAIKRATQILMQHFLQLEDLESVPQFEEEETKEVEIESNDILSELIDELELSARSLNCLKKAGIKTVNELVNMEFESLVKIKNFGKKSADEINLKLKQFNLSLKPEKVVE